jgi:hypothetical protein
MANLNFTKLGLVRKLWLKLVHQIDSRSSTSSRSRIFWRDPWVDFCTHIWRGSRIYTRQTWRRGLVVSSPPATKIGVYGSRGQIPSGYTKGGSFLNQRFTQNMLVSSKAAYDSLKIFTLTKSCHPIPRRDSISRLPNPQMETIPLDHAARVIKIILVARVKKISVCILGESMTEKFVFVSSQFSVVWENIVILH